GDIQKGNYNDDSDYDFYEAGTLYKTITTDENGHKIYEFKDKQGRVILKRSFVTEYPLSERPGPNPPTGTNKKADTYYVYDIYGNLAAVIPPLASEKTDPNATILANLCYIYKYDDRNRLIEKKLPGKGWEYMVYDKQDRLAATQDANLAADNKWLFTKYDKFGRVVYTGIFTSSASRATLQTSVNIFGSNNEERKTEIQFTQNALQVYYTKQAFPTTFTDVLTVNYYDKYVSLSVYGFQDPESAYDPNPRKETNGKLKGMPTETHNRILGTSQWEKSVTFYDQKSRPIRSYKLNHLGGYTDTDSDLNFRGLPLETTTKHLRNANAIEVKVKDVFAYDHQERLLTHSQKINNGTNNLIADNTYDKLGQLITKKVGGTQNGSDRWQEVDYKYNIRGWLTDINDVGLVLYGKDAEPPTMGDDLFAFKINYNVLNDGGSQYADPLYNGNISQTIWRTGDDNVKRGYVYNYDELNRLLEAQFYKSDNNPYTGAYTENLAYDLNGNITSLFRTTGDVNGESVGMDDLAYSYKDGNGNSNLLLNVSDAVSTGNSMGFVDGNTNSALDDYEYDENGNMVRDRNKGITSITYNHLNLPERVEWSANEFIAYQYNAAGQKVTKTVRSNDSIKVVRYLDGFQYAGDILQFFPHSEGYVKATPTGNITPGSPPTAYAYNYVFNYTDHLGNIRLSYTKDPQQGTLKILEENHYYPFGLKHEVYVTGSKRDFIENSNDPGETILTNVLKTDYQYKYNGKEWQDELGLNWTAMDFRNYDAALGRYHSPDPLSEYSMAWSPFRFAYDNPVFWSDSTGLYESIRGFSQSIGGFSEIEGGLSICPSCPNTPEFEGYINDPDYYYDYDPNTNSVTPIVELDEAEIWPNGKPGSETGNYDNEIAAFGVFRNIVEKIGDFSSSVLKDRFKYGEKYYNKPITIRTKLGPGINTNANSLKKLQKTGKLAGRTTKVLVVADVALSGEIRASHFLTTTMIAVNAIPVAGNVISGIYFGADLITMGASYFMTGEAKGIGDYLDQALDDAGVTNDGGKVVELYEGFY
ncbi:MAG: RHS repeat-associated core domain-containing protein, partial [Moheibacter sp.]